MGLCACGCGKKARGSSWFIRGHNRRNGGIDVPVEAPNPSGLCRCGCHQPTHIAKISNAATGDVAGFPRRYLPGHHVYKSEQPYTVAENGCWIWQRCFKSDGYGLFYEDRASGYRRRSAHVAMYEQKYGPVPEGSVLHHVCQDKACVNPDHLALMSPSEHARFHNPNRVPDEDIDEMRRLWATGMFTQRQLGEQFGVQQPYVSAVVRGKIRQR